MKKLLRLLLLTFLSIASCSKDDNSEKALNQEDGKQQLEDNSIAVLNKIEEFRDDSALQEIEEFLEFLITENDYDLEEGNNSEVFKRVKSTLLLSTELKENNISSIKYPSTLLKTISASSTTELEADFNDIVGTHTWENDEFNFIEGNDGKVIVAVTQNNKTATLTISNFSAYEHTSGEEAPKSMIVELKIDGTKIMGMDYNATIDANDYLPTNITASMSLGTLSYDMLVQNNNTNASITETLTIGDTKIIGLNLNVNGDFTDLNTFPENLEKGEDLDFSLMLNTVDATFSLGNTDVIFNAKNFDEFTEEVGEDFDEDKGIELLNDNFDVTIKSGNTKIADGEFYLETSTYTDYYYNNGNYIEEEIEEETPAIRLLFSDGSKSTLEAYFEVGFEDVLNNAEDVLDSYFGEDRDEIEL